EIPEKLLQLPKEIKKILFCEKKPPWELTDLRHEEQEDRGDIPNVPFLSKKFLPEKPLIFMELSKIWLHVAHIHWNQEKMSKSLGNVILAKHFYQKYGANTLRYLVLS
ncbi:12171_t:CDS:2, partial [Racocetra persica]